MENMKAPARRVIIMSGIPGSGKDTWIRDNFDKFLGHPVIVSADDYFCFLRGGGGYRFDASKLPQAHGACLRSFVGSVSRGTIPTVVVNNTNTTTEEIAPYYALAKAYDWEVTLVTLKASPRVCANRNIHGVKLEACERMARNLASRRLPRFWDLEEKELLT